MNHDDYCAHDGLGLAARIRSGEVSVDEVRAAALAAIESRNPALNAVLTVLERDPGASPGDCGADAPFAGVPFLIKELGLPATGTLGRAGSRLCSARPAATDSSLMSRFRAAGLALVGTTQTPEFGYNATTEPVAFGPVHNPWAHGISAGGSSGGSGAAVAAGIVPIGHANDGGGSIRIPAAANGLVGLKPTRDRIPTGPFAADPLYAHAIDFAVTRTVRDSAALLDAVAGPDEGAPHWIAPPTGSFLAAAERPPERVRFAVMSDSVFGLPSHPECVAAVDATARALESLGHERVDGPGLAFEFDEFVRQINRVWCAFVAFSLSGIERIEGRTAGPDDIEAVSRTCADFGRRLSATDLLEATAYVNAISRRTAAAWRGFDVLLTPALSTPPVAHGVLDQNDATLGAEDWTRRTFEYAGHTPLFNSTGQPAITLPMHRTAADLPVGVQLVAPPCREDLLLGIAAALETTDAWRGGRTAPPGT